MKIITLDFETAYDKKEYTLSKMGPIEYIRDPRFHTLCLGVCIDKNPPTVFEHKDIPEVLKSLELHKQDRMIVGHNLFGFDALVLSEIYNIHPFWMLDTMVMMRWIGLSRIIGESHGSLTKYLGSGNKWEGTVLSDGKYRQEQFNSYEWDKFKSYCADDTSQCRDNFYKMIDFMTPHAIKFSTLTARMATDPVFVLDSQILDQYIKELDIETETAMLNICHMFSFHNKEEFLEAIRSPIIFPDMLRQLGVDPPKKYSSAKTNSYKAKLELERTSLSISKQRREEIDFILSDPDNYAQYSPAMAKTDLDFISLQQHHDPRVSLLVQTRLEQNSSILRSRAERFKELSLSGRRLPIMLSAFKAHTSRYTAGNEGVSDGLNMQNLNKRDKKKQTLRRAIKVPEGMKLVAADSSQIEARLLAYIAGQTDLVEQFRHDQDPYSQLAEKIFNVPWQEIRAGAKKHDIKMDKYRFVGKTGILSAGYQVGKKKFSDTLLRGGAKLHDDIDKHHELAFHAHYIYRESNPAIVFFWSRMGRVIEHLYQGGTGKFGGPSDNIFWYGKKQIINQGDMIPCIQMPTGYCLWYPNLRPETDEKGRAQFYYDRRRRSSAVKTKLYGGALTENIIQSLSFQLLMWQAVSMWDTSGIIVKGNNHDCWYTVVPYQEADKTLERMVYHMSQIPEWLPGFPVACEGDIGDDFTIA